jgi:cation:H+ antiporter
MWQMDIVCLLGGLVLILLGANYLTDGASSLAKNLKVSDLVIGLTVVAFGTSAPELAVSITSALKGSADISIGNVVGSNMFNTLMIVGCTAFFAPIILTKNTLLKEIPLCILASIALLAICNDKMLDNQHLDIISRTDGILLLLLFIIFMVYTFSIARQNNHEEAEEVKQLPLWLSPIYIIGGMAALVYGGNIFVDGATGIARSLGVSESVIGLTLVAGGTSLPELATSVVAALKKSPEMAIGNVVGSNLFNIFLVLGVSATISPLHLIGINNFDLWSLVLACILLWFFGVFYKTRTITRIEGTLLVVCYVAYTILVIIMS